MPKYVKLLNNINNSFGSSFVYSQFNQQRERNFFKSIQMVILK